MTEKTRQSAIQRARAHAYVRQKRLREKLKRLVDEAIEVNVRLAVKNWQRKEIMSEVFRLWLEKADYPAECADLVRWMTSNQRDLFASYNPYMLGQAMKAGTAAGAFIETAGTKVAHELAREMKEVHRA
jgi:hypothetical protein